MRKLLMTLAAVVLAGGGALAGEGYAGAAMRADLQTVRVNRYAFDTIGKSEDETAAIRCGGGQIGTTHRHRTMGDVAAAVFTGGWYTPEHVDVQCSTTASLR